MTKFETAVQKIDEKGPIKKTQSEALPSHTKERATNVGDSKTKAKPPLHMSGEKQPKEESKEPKILVYGKRAKNSVF